jgi:hypothetical protein
MPTDDKQRVNPEMAVAFWDLDEKMKSKLIDDARKAIAHTTDGPVTAFVLISRACYTAKHGLHDWESLAEALNAELVERGYLDPNADLDEVPGS